MKLNEAKVARGLLSRDVAEEFALGYRMRLHDPRLSKAGKSEQFDEFRHSSLSCGPPTQNPQGPSPGQKQFGK